MPGHGHFRFCTLAMLVVVLLLVPRPGRADDARQARALFEKGEVQYRLGKFKLALGHYQAALKLVRRPSIVYNIAQCYLQLGEHKKALFNYKLFLSDYARINPEIWSSAARSLDGQQQIRITYIRFDGVEGEYLVDPYHLLGYHGEWYLIGLHHRRNTVASFALSRAGEITPTGRFFAAPEGFRAEEWIRERFGITGAEKPFGVRLRFSPKVAAYIRHRVWHPTQEIVECAHGGLELRMETTGWKELVRWILSWQPDAQVLAPQRLRERVEEKMRIALSR